MPKRGWFFILVLLLAGCGGNQPAYKCQDCNVILISIDTLRADHLGCYGYFRNTSPNIDAFAKDSFLFKHAFSQAPWTRPSFTSLFSSQYPNQLPMLKRNTTTLTTLLKQHGYLTAAFNDGGFVSHVFNFDIGFNDFDDTGYGIVKIYNKTVSWLRKNYNSKFFLWMHTYEINSHSRSFPLPYGAFNTNFSKLYIGNYTGNFNGCYKSVCGSPFISAYNTIPYILNKEDIHYIIALYDQQINLVDYYIGRLIDELKSKGIYNKTIIVFHADHGEEFFEHGRFRHGQVLNSLYTPLLRVPLILHIPNTKPRVIGDNVGLIDLAPTLLSTLGIKQRAKEFQGKDLFESNQVVFSMKRLHSEPVTFLPIKTIFTPSFDIQLYNLSCTNASEAIDTCVILHFSDLNQSKITEARRLGLPSYSYVTSDSYREDWLPVILQKAKEEINQSAYKMKVIVYIFKCGPNYFALKFVHNPILHNASMDLGFIKSLIANVNCSNLSGIRDKLPVVISSKSFDLRENSFSVFYSNFSLVINRGGNTRYELYNFVNDPMEQNPLRNASLLSWILDKINKSNPPFSASTLEPPRINLSSKVEQRLHNLGYI